MSTIELINTGILMGIIDVLTGPDHLSALATLCGTNIHDSRHRSRRESFLLGIRWGVGHSLGLLAVGGLLIAMEESSGEWIGMDPVLSMVLEGFVGTFMLALGGYGLITARRHHGESLVSEVMSDTSYRRSVEILKLQEGDFGKSRTEDDAEIVSRMEGVLESDSEHASMMMDGSMHSITTTPSSGGALHDLPECDESHDRSHLSFETVPMKAPHPMALLQPSAAPQRPALLQETKPPSTTNLVAATSLMNSHTSPDHSGILGVSDSEGGYFRRCCGMGGRNLTPGKLAVVAGIFHGVAGPGGVLGVIPAAQLRDARSAVVYLGMFCLTSTCVMGGFAAFYGSLSEWLAGGGGPRGRGSNRVYAVEVGSALLSVCVGLIWLVLLSLGKLGEVFP